MVRKAVWVLAACLSCYGATEPLSAADSYQLGVRVAELSAAERAERGIEGPGGLLVLEAREPAAAELRAGDVLLRAGETPLRTSRELAARIAKGRPLTLLVQDEGGRTREVVVQPRAVPEAPFEDRLDEAIREALKFLEENEAPLGELELELGGARGGDEPDAERSPLEFSGRVDLAKLLGEMWNRSAASRQDIQRLEQRLERLEAKLDRILEQLERE